MMRNSKLRKVWILSLVTLIFSMMMPMLASASEQVEFFYNEDTKQLTGSVLTKDSSEIKLDIEQANSSENKSNIPEQPLTKTNKKSLSKPPSQG